MDGNADIDDDVDVDGDGRKKRRTKKRDAKGGVKACVVECESKKQLVVLGVDDDSLRLAMAVAGGGLRL